MSTSPGDSDEPFPAGWRLAARYRAGAPDSEDPFVRYVLAVVTPVARTILRDPDLAREVAQDAVLDALRGIGDFRDPGALDAWLRTITLRRALRAQAKHRRRALNECPLEELPLHAEACQASDPYAALEQKLGQDSFRTMTATLSHDQQTALWLRHALDLSQAQIAAVMEVPLGTVGALLSRGHARIRDSMVG